jgi:hypothetical protein
MLIHRTVNVRIKSSSPHADSTKIMWDSITLSAGAPHSVSTVSVIVPSVLSPGPQALPSMSHTFSNSVHIKNLMIPQVLILYFIDTTFMTGEQHRSRSAGTSLPYDQDLHCSHLDLGRLFLTMKQTVQSQQLYCRFRFVGNIVPADLDLHLSHWW